MAVKLKMNWWWIAISALLLLVAGVALAFVFRQNTSPSLIGGVVKHQSCINQGFPCREDYVVLSDGSVCAISNAYRVPYENREVLINGERKIEDVAGQGPQICLLDIKEIRSAQ